MNVPIPILLADDDLDDCRTVREAPAESRLADVLFTVPDGEALLDFLHRRGPYAAPGAAPRSGLIRRDVNMPKLDGRQVLERIKGDPTLRTIPIVVPTTSHADKDIRRGYDLGADSFVTKPATVRRLVTVVRGPESYWFEIVELPRMGEGGR